MQRIVIFEGPDRCGKTQIAQELSRRLNVPYFKNEDEIRNFLDPKEYFVNTLRYADPYFLSFLKQTGHSAIIDRHYPSEWVYSKVFGRQTDEKALRRTDSAMAALGTVIVLCGRSDYSRYEDDLFPDKIDSKQLLKLNQMYEKFVEWTSCQVIKLNVDDEDLDREVREILSALGEDIPPSVDTSGMCYDLVEDDLYDDADTDDNEEDDSYGYVSPPPVYPDPDKDWSDVTE